LIPEKKKTYVRFSRYSCIKSNIEFKVGVTYEILELVTLTKVTNPSVFSE